MKWVIGLAVGAVCGVAWGQAEPVLQGPRVEVKKIPGVEEGFGGEPGMMQRMAGRPVPLQVMQRAIASLNGDGVAEELRLTEEQVEAIRRLTAEFRESVAAYMREHPQEAQEMRRLARSIPEGLRPEVDRRVTDRTAADAGSADRGKEAGEGADAALVAAERMEAIRRGMPDVLGLQTRIWNELTEAQRAHLTVVLEEWREEEERRWSEAYVQRRLAAREQGAEAPRPAGPPADAQRLDVQRIMERLPEEMRQRFEGMSEAERAVAIQRIRERIAGSEGVNADGLMERLPERLRARLMELSEEERAAVLERIRRRFEGVARGRGVGLEGGRAKPPPSISEVQVPDPEGKG